jgi:hypothetical protein
MARCPILANRARGFSRFLQQFAQIVLQLACNVGLHRVSSE